MPFDLLCINIEQVFIILHLILDHRFFIIWILIDSKQPSNRQPYQDSEITVCFIWLLSPIGRVTDKALVATASKRGHWIFS